MYTLMCAILSATVSSARAFEVVAHGPSSSPALRLAAADASRYLRLLRCGHGPSPAACAGAAPLRAPAVHIGVSSALPPSLLGAPFNGTAGGTTLGTALAGLSGDAHVVAPVAGGGVVCAGPTPRAALYAVYTLLEALGARFFITGDVLPAPNAALALPAAPLLREPAFAERGLNPFHDFPMVCVCLCARWALTRAHAPSHTHTHAHTRARAPLHRAQTGGPLTFIDSHSRRWRR